MTLREVLMPIKGELTNRDYDTSYRYTSTKAAK